MKTTFLALAKVENKEADRLAASLAEAGFGCKGVEFEDSYIRVTLGEWELVLRQSNIGDFYLADFFGDGEEDDKLFDVLDFTIESFYRNGELLLSNDAQEIIAKLAVAA